VRFYPGDDSSITFPVTDNATPPGNLSFSPTVVARRWLLGTIVDINAEWLGAAGASRDLKVPLGSLTSGLWVLRLTLAGETDLVLGEVVIQ
jgi:hypothetical protein